MRSPYLGKGVIWALREFGKVGINDIVQAIGWKRKKVYDELRRLTHMSALGFWIQETRTKEDMYFELDPVMRGGTSVECLCEIARKTFKFKSKIKKGM